MGRAGHSVAQHFSISRRRRKRGRLKGCLHQVTRNPFIPESPARINPKLNQQIAVSTLRPALSLAFRTTRAYGAVPTLYCTASAAASIPPLTATTPHGNACYDNRQQYQALEIDATYSEARRNNKTVVEHVEQADKHQKRDEDPEHATP